jgi:hypothetical protein
VTRPAPEADVLSAQLSAVLTELDAAIYTRFSRQVRRPAPVTPARVVAAPVTESPLTLADVAAAPAAESPLTPSDVAPSGGPLSPVELSHVPPALAPEPQEIAESPFKEPRPPSSFEESATRAARRPEAETPHRNRIVDTLVSVLERIVESMGRARRPLAKRSRLPRHRLRRR